MQYTLVHRGGSRFYVWASSAGCFSDSTIDGLKAHERISVLTHFLGSDAEVLSVARPRYNAMEIYNRSQGLTRPGYRMHCSCIGYLKRLLPRKSCINSNSFDGLHAHLNRVFSRFIELHLSRGTLETPFLRRNKASWLFSTDDRSSFSNSLLSSRCKK